MNPETPVKEKLHEKLTEWKALAEHLNVQLHLGLADAKDEFEMQKKALVKWIDEIIETSDELKNISHQSVLRLKTLLEELRVQAALGKADTEDLLKEQQSKLEESIVQIQRTIPELYKDTENKIELFTNNVADKLENFHTKFDLFRLQFHLGKLETEEKWEDKKKELTGKLSEFKSELEKEREEFTDKWEHFHSELAEAWKHVRSAFKNN